MILPRILVYTFLLKARLLLKFHYTKKLQWHQVYLRLSWAYKAQHMAWAAIKTSSNLLYIYPWTFLTGEAYKTEHVARDRHVTLGCEKSKQNTPKRTPQVWHLLQPAHSIMVHLIWCTGKPLTRGRQMNKPKRGGSSSHHIWPIHSHNIEESHCCCGRTMGSCNTVENLCCGHSKSMPMSHDKRAEVLTLGYNTSTLQV